MSQLNIDPRLGDMIQQAIEQMTGVHAQLILIAMPTPNDLGDRVEPTFITSLPVDVMEQVIISIGAKLADPDFIAAGRDITGQGSIN